MMDDLLLLLFVTAGAFYGGWEGGRRHQLSKDEKVMSALAEALENDEETAHDTARWLRAVLGGIAILLAATAAHAQPALARSAALAAPTVQAPPEPAPRDPRFAMGTVCPVYDAPPGEDDLKCDFTLGISLRPNDWKRVPHVHPWIGFGARSLSLGVAYVFNERYAFGVGAMARREDYLSVERVTPCVAFTVGIGGGK